MTAADSVIIEDLRARLSAAVAERDTLRDQRDQLQEEVNSYETPLPYKVGYEDGKRDAEARAEAAETMNVTLAETVRIHFARAEAAELAMTVALRVIGKAALILATALAGREGTGGG